MAIEEVSARDIGCTGTLVITVVPRGRHTARLRDRRDRPDKGSRPMSAAALEADTGTFMAEG